MIEKIKETAAYIAAKVQVMPKTAIILGTGLGELVDHITDKTEIPYTEIPNFPVSTVEGHQGKLIFGKLGKKDVMAMQGRFHYYLPGACHERTRNRASLRFECSRRYESRFCHRRYYDYP